MNVKRTIASVATIVFALLLFIRYKINTVYKISNVQVWQDYTFVEPSLNKSSNASGSHREDFLIDTPGCYIPNYAKDSNYGEPYASHQSCGQRAVFIKKQHNSNNIMFRMTGNLLKQAKKNKIKCCYRFAKRSTIRDREDTHISYTSCLPFMDKVVKSLEEEVIIVKCVQNTPKEPIKTIIYEDAYIVLKGLKKTKKNVASKSWNVIVLGVGSMTRGRMISLMPSTTQELEDKKWLQFLGYNKVAWNTYDNFMSLLTGRKLSTIRTFCGANDNGCNELMIWSMFKDAGYVTAYGEDHLTLRDTLEKNRFKTPPTDHYMRPFFLTGEKRVDNIICTKNAPSVNHLLNYASDFINFYKDVPFFGSFWINSCSTQNMSAIIDKAAVDFISKLKGKNILRNTFVFLVGADGNIHGDFKFPINSYYEDQLPVLFVNAPEEFKSLYKSEYHNMKLNQERLITPYDVYLTFINILNINKSNAVESEACSQSTSLFQEKSLQRTCTEACIDQNWCSCQGLTKVEQKDYVNSTVVALVSYIQNRTSNTHTLPCTTCEVLTLKNILRIHTYKSVGGKGYVIAFEMDPGKLLFEATIASDAGVSELIQNENFMTLKYNRKGFCVINEKDRPFCVCRKTLCN